MAAQKSKKTKLASIDAKSLVKVDPKLKKAYDALVASIEKSSRKEAFDFDELWEAVGKVVDHDPPLYVMGGFANADAFYRSVAHEEPRNARRYVRVAKYASPQEEDTYGVSKLDAALGFIEAKIGKSLEHPPLPIAFERLRIPVDGGKTKTLAAATVPEITRATSKLTSGAHRKAKTPAATALTESIGKVSSLEGVRIHEKNGVVSFSGIPLAAIHHFVRALTQTKWPADKPKA
jgi:N-acetylglucosamine kinase-like BadF-type ATPase